MENIRAVIFDLDNTLADRKYAFSKHAESCAEVFLADSRLKEPLIKSFPRPLSNGFSRAGNDGCAFNQRFLKEKFTARLIELDCNGYRPKKEVYDTIAAEFPLNCTAREIEDSWNPNADRFIRPEPGAEDILKYLSEKYTLALLTNGYSRTQNIKLDRVGLRKYFAAVIISEETGTAKPDPEIFRMICGKIGVSAENCVYIGDSFENDIKGAASAGMQAVFYDRYKTSKENYLPTVSDLRELKLLL